MASEIPRLTDRRAWFSVALAAALAVLALGAAPANPAAPPPKPAVMGEAEQDALLASLPGDWRAVVGRELVTLTFDEKGFYQLSGAFWKIAKSGAYSIEGGKLKLTAASGSAVYACEMTGAKMKLSGGDLAQPIEFLRKGQGARAVLALMDVTRPSFLMRLRRIGLVLLVVVICRLIVAGLQRLSHFVIFSDWGPLRLAFQKHKSRIMTLHAVGLNVLKYIIYFTGLGFVLTELGVDYTAYLASLSVIGLAISFGSQGLVQDVVTGFFIIFEGQFDVGDMIEVSGQTGIVTQLGLRTTLIRNALGEIMSIPNRTIGVVGNFTKGAVRGRIDVAVADDEAAEKAKPILETLGKELKRQFGDVIVEAPRPVETIELETGERFVRVETAIWPKENWVIDQQFLPRLREAFGREELAIPNDRVVVSWFRDPEPRFRRKRERAEAPA